MSRDNQVYADAIMLAYCGVGPSERIERERKAFAVTLKNKTALLASHRGPRRSRNRAPAPETEAENFGAKLTAAIKWRLARRR